jgi:hypothetical protein
LLGVEAELKRIIMFGIIALSSKGEQKSLEFHIMWFTVEKGK